MRRPMKKINRYYLLLLFISSSNYVGDIQVTVIVTDGENEIYDDFTLTVIPKNEPSMAAATVPE